MPSRRKSYPHQPHHDYLHHHHQEVLQNEDFIPQRPFRRLSGSTISSGVDGELSTVGNRSILSRLKEAAGDRVVLLDEDEPHHHPRKEWQTNIGSCDAAAAATKDVPIKKPARFGSTVVSAGDDSTITTYYTTNMNNVEDDDDQSNPTTPCASKKWLDASIKKEDSPPQPPVQCRSVASTSVPPPAMDETSISSEMHAKEDREEEEAKDDASICDSLIKEHWKQKTMFSTEIYTLVHDPNNYKAKEQPNIKTPTVKVLPHDDTLMQRKRRVEKFWICMNQRDYEGALDQCTSNCNLVFRGYEYKIKKTVPVQAGLGRTKAVIDAIPDFTFHYSSIEESCYVKGALVALNFLFTGHHTGCALSLPPLPPIPVSNKHVVLDEAEQHYYFDSVTNRISRIEEIALGETCGLMGVYVILSRP